MTKKSDGSKRTTPINRRDFVKTATMSTAAAAVSSSMIPKRVFAQTQKDVTFTLSWIPNGGSAWVDVGREKGIFKKHGFNVDVTRGFGSSASAQAVGQGKFNFGISSAAASYLQCAKGMKIAHLGCASYSSAMGIGYLRNNGIATPKDLEGKKMGCVVASGEYPFLPVMAERAGFDLSKVEIVQVDNKIRTGVLLSKQVSAISCFASSVAPDVTTKGYDVGWFLYDSYDMGFYGYMLITQPEMYAKDKGLCEAFAEAHMESVMYTMLNPEEAHEIFIKRVPEAGLTKAQRDALALEIGLFTHINLVPEVKEHGVGSISMDSYKSMADLIMKHVAAPGDTAPNLEEMLFTDHVTDKFKFTPEQLASLEEYAKPFAKVLS
ncbi:MAG: ABC transporter substrate-binding protein [Rhodospirillaceae bacterium]